MKRHTLLLSLGLGLIATLVFAQYSLDWSTMDSGGGTSTGGVYAVTGTIGQPDAGTMTGGPFELLGGFWGAVIPVQQEGAPTLSISQGGPNVTLSWMPNTPGFVLQELNTLTLAPGGWANALSGATNPVVIPASMQTRYFRLVRP